MCIQGVTLLALGNGAPDIFAALSSITQLKDGDAGLAFGGLLGAGLFVTSITAGAIAIVKPFKSMRRPIIKDMVFYLFAVFWAFIILMKRQGIEVNLDRCDQNFGVVSNLHE